MCFMFEIQLWFIREDLYRILIKTGPMYKRCRQVVLVMVANLEVISGRKPPHVMEQEEKNLQTRTALSKLSQYYLTN